MGAVMAVCDRVRGLGGRASRHELIARRHRGGVRLMVTPGLRAAECRKGTMCPTRHTPAAFHLVDMKSPNAIGACAGLMRYEAHETPPFPCGVQFHRSHSQAMWIVNSG